MPVPVPVPAAAWLGGGSFKGPFWPQAPSSSKASSVIAVRRRGAPTLGVFSILNMRRSMTDSEYHDRADALLHSLETLADRWLDEDVIDVDAQRTGGLLELVFADRSKLVINKQPPLHEIWLASRRGGFHFQWRGGDWLDTKTAASFGAVFDAEASHHGGRPLTLSS